MLKVQNVEEMINSKTKMIWIETPTNPMMNIIDIKGMVSIARKILWFVLIILLLLIS